MNIIEFPEQTIVYAENQPRYRPMPAYKYLHGPEGRVVCCWSLTILERILLLFRGVIWHQVLTFNTPIQPQLLSLQKPYMPKHH